MRLMLVQKGCKIAPEDPDQVHKFKKRSKGSKGTKSAPKGLKIGPKVVKKDAK